VNYSDVVNEKSGYEDFLASCEHAKSVSLLATVDGLLQWDEQTMLPAAAGDFRAEQAAALAALTHAQRTKKEQGERLEKLADSSLATDGPEFVQATIRLLHEDFQKQSRVPERLVEEIARTSIESQQEWVRAVKASEWKKMVVHLEKMFSLKRELAMCQSPKLDPYDALMDDYEPGARWRSVDATFSRLRKALAPLVRGCLESTNGPQDAVLRGTFPLLTQQTFVRQIIEKIGFQFERGRLDTTAHPFCSTLGPNDCRLTTRWDEAFLPTALYSVLHETGHGLYEQGLPVDWFGLPPGEATSLGIHESQSRLWENLVGRSPEFWEWCYPLARKSFPESFDDVT
jgi:carboxypeptidase Taq